MNHQATRPRAGLLALGLAGLVSLLPPALSAQSVCIPDHGFVPYLAGSPNWWDSVPGQPLFWPRPDDPRWLGSFVKTSGGGGSGAHVTFRAQRSANDLYLSWQVDIDPQVDDADELWVAFSLGGANPDALIEVIPFSTANPNVPANGQPPFQVAFSTRTPGNPFAAAVLPNWLDPVQTHIRVWHNMADHSWTVNLHVPITAVAANGLNLPNTFKMWHEVEVSHSNNQVASYSYPTAIDLNNVVASTNSTGWADARRDLAAGSAGCLMGISLASSDIGTEATANDCGTAAATLSSNIKLTNGAGSPGSNTFCARPKNETGNPVNNPDLEATFRIANWGTQPANINNIWTKINPLPVSGAPGSIANNGKGNLHYTWNLSLAEACSFTPLPPGINCTGQPAPTHQRHQCMLVELNGAPGTTFINSGTSRNMDFVNASTFSREAEVSVVGLPALPGNPPQRDVYLYVKADNLPASFPGGEVQKGVVIDSVPVPPPLPDPNKNPGIIQNPNDPGGPGGQGPGTPGNLPPLAKEPFEMLRETAPTYQVYAFHDTGRTITLRGHVYKLIEPQTSFGYFVSHQGELVGWRHSLTGAQQIAPNYYRIAVPQNGTKTIVTTIEAIEPAKWSLSVHAGLNDPQGDLGRLCDGDRSVGLDLEYQFRGRYAAELFYGRDDLDCQGRVKPRIDHLALNGKIYFPAGMFRPFLLVGIGQYDLDPGPTETGVAVGAGVQINPWPHLGLELTGKYHLIDTSGSDVELVTLQLGARIRF